ncbi:MAG: Guanine deaminase [Turneriella sp.]|nr:Guanine deaminase [Turneriella sp.]
MQQKKKGLCAAFINPTPNGSVDFLGEAYLLWNHQGVIEYFSSEKPSEEKIRQYEIAVHKDKIAIPGLIDLHTHLPQYEFAAQGSVALLPWLQKYTFPQEARFLDASCAQTQSKNFFRHCLLNGTTTVVAYLSSFLEAAQIAFEEASRTKIRAYLGLTLMDRGVPKEIQTTAVDAQKNMLSLIDTYHKKNGCEFVVTPRFALSCTDALLTLCGEVSHAYKLFLQTHISENTAEVEETLRLFPQCKSYTDVYNVTGCLHERTLLGHGIHLEAKERQLIREKKSAVIHCPTSNNFLGSGIFSYDTLHKEKTRIGLGTDVAGGYSLSMLNEAKQSIEMAKLRAHFDNCSTDLNASHALYQATLGNAAILSRENELGSFSIGKFADIALIDDSKCDPMFGAPPNFYSSLPERLNRILYRSHPDMVASTFIAGEIVFER